MAEEVERMVGTIRRRKNVKNVFRQWMVLLEGNSIFSFVALEHWFSNCCCIWVSWRVYKTDCRAASPSPRVSDSEPRSSISNKSPGHADAAGTGTQCTSSCATYCVYISSFSPFYRGRNLGSVFLRSHACWTCWSRGWVATCMDAVNGIPILSGRSH